MNTRMRIAVVACLLLAACERVPASRQDPPSPPPPPVQPQSDLERLRSELARITVDDTLYLAELGWFALRHYESYEGRNPRTGERVFVPEVWQLFFRAHPNLTHELNGEPRESIADPLRYLDSEDAARHVAWADTLAASIRTQLIAKGEYKLEGIGTFLIADPDFTDLSPGELDERAPLPKRARVRWGTADALQAVLGKAR